MEKYSWSFDPDAEVWGNDAHNTIKDCIKDAVATAKNDGTAYPDVVYIGENRAFIPNVDAETVLDCLEEEAGEFCGEVGDDWCAYNSKKREELEELSKALTAVAVEWMKKHGYSPRMYIVEDIKEHSITIRSEANHGMV